MPPNQSNQRSQQLQQHSNGQYEVVPTLSPSGTRQSGHNPYEFIVNPNTPKQGIGLFGRGGTPWKGMALIGGALVVALMVVAVVVSSMTPKGSTPGLTAAAQRQQEIIRIATAGAKTASGQDVRNFATNIEFSLTSDQEQTLAYLQSHGTKLKKQQLALDQDTQTDSLLANALTAGTYDVTLVQTLTTQLQTYQSVLKSTYQQTNVPAARTLLHTNYNNAAALLAQAKSLNPASAQ